MELLKLPGQALETALNVGRFVLDRMTVGGWSDLPAPANITVNGEQLDEQTN